MKVGIALLCLFIKIDRIHSFEIRHSLFDIRRSSNLSIRLMVSAVSNMLTPEH